MARAAGVSPASVQRLWAASDIKPHLSRTFKLSNDKRFEEKFWDVIGIRTAFGLRRRNLVQAVGGFA
jgi:hypothetical protein